MNAIEEVQKRIEAIESQIDYQRDEVSRCQRHLAAAHAGLSGLESLLVQWREIQARVA